MLRGATQSGGEIGHMVIDRNGAACVCGRRGCVETFASVGATIDRVRRSLERGQKSLLTNSIPGHPDRAVEAVVSAARHGDTVARAALAETAEALGIGIANAVQLLNPSLVVLAGKFAYLARALLLEGIRRAIQEQCFEAISRAVEVRVARFDKDVGAVGCALLASVDMAGDIVKHCLSITPLRR
jgi:glucokinase